MFKLINFLLITTLTVIIKCSTIQNNETQIWAVLIAGSNDWYNYRHQADVCHAYHVLVNHGVPRDNIIVMMYDDIANNTYNPTPGIIINKPNGPNVYVNVSKDYVGDEVSKVNFLGVLRGNETLASQGKKVLRSGPNDHVFIYFVDHGGVGLLGMPNYDYLYSLDLNDTLSYMHQNGLYGKMTLYIEACESGSMFENILPNNISIFVTTSAMPNESSWATYYDIYYGTYLGDEYSVNWLENSDSEKSLFNETLEQQFKVVRSETKQSTPQQYGDKSFRNLPVAQFQGEKTDATSSQNSIETKVRKSVDSREVPIEIMKHRIQQTNDPITRAALETELSAMLAGRKHFEQTFRSIIADLCKAGLCSSVEHVMSIRRPLVNHAAYSQVAKEYHESCSKFSRNAYALRFMYVLVNIIEDLQSVNKQNVNIFRSVLKQSCAQRANKVNFKNLV